MRDRRRWLRPGRPGRSGRRWLRQGWPGRSGRLTRSGRSGRRASTVLAALAALMSAGGCASAAAGPPVQRGGPAVTWVDLAEPLPATVTDPRLYWESIVEQSAMPYWATTFVVTLPPSWTSDPAAVVREALALRPTVVTVEAGLLEAGSGRPSASLAAALASLLAGLKQAHNARVLVANLPTPAGGAAAGSGIAADDAAIAAAAGAAGDPLVDLGHALGPGDLQGNELTAAGERAVAAVFVAAIDRHR